MGTHADVNPQTNSEGWNGRLTGGRTVHQISTYPPTQCGLATFAAATRSALATARPSWGLPVIEVSGGPNPAGGPSRTEVVGEWRQNHAYSLVAALHRINRGDCLLIQHEFGIYGGTDGSEILDLVAAATCPVVIVLHTVLDAPSASQRHIVESLGQKAAQLIVLSEVARDRLLLHYSITSDRVLVIPHGAHPVPFRIPLSTPRIPVLLTWGLVGPTKGLERSLLAVAQLRQQGVEVVYKIVGETHPNVRKTDGEGYRKKLQKRAAELGIADCVVFDSNYHTVSDLMAIISDADIVLTPYDSRDQITSGVLAEALAAGKIVISTAYPHAVEMLADGAGFVVDHDDEGAIATVVLRLLEHPEYAQWASRIALRRGRPMLWGAVGEALASALEAVISPAAGSDLDYIQGNDMTLTAQAAR